MEERWLWYFAGSMDSILRVQVTIRSAEKTTIGYTITPQLSFSRPSEIESIFGMVDEYVEEVGSDYYIEEQRTSNRLLVRGHDNVKRFLEPLDDRFIQQRERVDFYMDDILPKFEDGSPDTKSEFLDVVKEVDELEEYPVSSYESKYDPGYFKRRWGKNP